MYLVFPSRKIYSSEIRGLCLIKLTSKMVQNLPTTTMMAPQIQSCSKLRWKKIFVFLIPKI